MPRCSQPVAPIHTAARRCPSRAGRVLPTRRPRIRWNAARRSGPLAERGRLVKSYWRRMRRPGESLKAWARRQAVSPTAEHTRAWLLAKGCRL